MTDDDPKPVQHEKSLGEHLHTAVELGAFPVAGLAGYKAFELAVHGDSYKTKARLGRFNDLQKPVIESRTELLTRASTFAAQSDKEALLKQAAEQNTQYRLDVKKRFEEMGFRSLRDHWRDLSPNHKGTALVFAATTAATIVGAVLLATQNKFIKEHLFRIKPDESKTR